MMRKYALWLLIIPFCLCFGSLAWGADDPSITWQEIETEHFVIHYPVTREVFARRALVIAEEAHKALVPYLEWAPRTKTHISVTDNLDEANGWARPTPRNEIRLYAWPPELNEELGYYDDWMRQLIYHEYTHILHTDTSGGLHTVLNVIFGKFARNNATTPRWYAEGLAVYYESLLSHSGRLRNALYRIVLRNAAQAQKIPTLGDLSTGLKEWPGGSASYIYGAFFIADMAQKYGRKSLIRWNHAYGNDWVPYAMNRAAMEIWGKTWDVLYEEWRQNVYHETQIAIQQAEENNNLTPSHTWIKPWRHERPQVIPHENAISYVRNDGTKARAIVEYNLDTHQETILTQCQGRCEHHWSEDGKTLYFTFAKTIDGYKRHEKIYRLDLSTKNVVPLDISGRVRAFDIDKNHIYRVVQTNESVKIYKNILPELEDILLYEGQPFEQIDEISVKNGQIIASRFDPQKHRSDIYKFENQQWIPLTNDKAPDISPYWRHDGRIGYVSVASGEMNLWSVDLQGNDRKRHTHLLTGILHVSEAQNGDIYYTTYTHQGTTIAYTKTEELANISHDIFELYGFEFQETADTPIPSENEVIPNTSKPRPYRPWHWLWPMSWSPRLAWNPTDGVRLGLSFGANDLADHHQYQFQVDYLMGKNAIDFIFSYLWSGLPWDLKFSTSLIQETGQYYNAKHLKPYDYQVFTGDISASHVWNMMTSTHQLSLGFHVEYREAHSVVNWVTTDPAAAPPTLPSLGWMNALMVNWAWSNMRQSEKSLVPDAGYYVSAMLRLEGPWMGSQHHALIGKCDVNGAWTMPWLEGHIINAAVAAGFSWADSIQRQPFKLSSKSGVSLGLSDVALHGYPDGLLQGQHFMYAKASYTAPIWNIQAGYSTLPVGITRLGASLFGEWGYTWSGDKFNILHSKYTIGGKLYLDGMLGYRLPVRVTLGYAWGGAPHGGHHGFIVLDL